MIRPTQKKTVRRLRAQSKKKIKPTRWRFYSGTQEVENFQFGVSFVTLLRARVGAFILQDKGLRAQFAVSDFISV